MEFSMHVLPNFLLVHPNGIDYLMKNDLLRSDCLKGN